MDEVKLFVGAVPYGLDESALRKTVATWSDLIVNIFYLGTGFCVIEFKTVKERNRVFESHKKSKKAIANHIVDIKPFITHNHLKIGKDPIGAQAKKSSSSSTAPNNEASAIGYSNGSARHVTMTKSIPSTGKLSSLGSGVSARTFPVGMPHESGVITGHIDNEYVLIRTSNSSNGFAHAKAVFYCSQHCIQCNVPDCPNYSTFSTNDSSKKLGQALPINTQLNFFSQQPPFAQGTKGLSFQVQLAWPSLSRKPSENTKCPSNEELKTQARDVLVKISRFHQEKDSNTNCTNNGKVSGAKEVKTISTTSASIMSSVPPGFSEPQFSPSRSNLLGDNSSGSRSMMDSSSLSKYDSTDGRSLSDFFATNLPSTSESSRAALVQAILTKRKSESGDKFEAMVIVTVHNFMSQHNLEMEKGKKDHILALLRVLLHQISQNNRRSNSLYSEDPLKRLMEGPNENSNSSQASAHLESDVFSSTSRSRTESPLLRTLTDIGALKINLDSSDVSLSGPITSAAPEWLHSMARDIIETHHLKTQSDAVANLLFISWGEDNDMFHQLKQLLLRDIINMKQLYLHWTDTVERVWQLRTSSKEVDVAFIVKLTAKVMWTSLSMSDPVWSGLQSIFCNTVVTSQTGNMYNVRGIVMRMEEHIGVVMMPNFGTALLHVDVINEKLLPGELVKVHVVVNEDYNYVVKLWRLGRRPSNCYSDIEEPLSGPEKTGNQRLWTRIRSDFDNFVKNNVDLVDSKSSISLSRDKYDALLADSMARKINSDVNACSKEETSTASSLSAETLEKQRISTFDAFLKYVRQPKLGIKPIEHLGIAGSVMVLAKMGMTSDRLRQYYTFRALLGAEESFEELIELYLISCNMSEIRGKFSTFKNISNLLKQFYSQEEDVVQSLEESRHRIEQCENEYPYKFLVVVEEVKRLVVDGADDLLMTTDNDNDNDVKPSALEADASVNELKSEIRTLRETVRRLEEQSASIQSHMSEQDRKLEEQSRRLSDLVKMSSSSWSGHDNQPQVTKSQERLVVCIKGSDESSAEVFELLTDDQQQLSVDAVKAIFPNVTALKYRKDERTRILNKVNNIFDPPDDGWKVKGRIFIANTNSNEAHPNSSTAINGSGLLPRWPYPSTTGLGLPPGVGSAPLPSQSIYPPNNLRGFVAPRAGLQGAAQTLFQFPRV